MGVHHRQGDSPPIRVRFGKRTIKDGEAVSVWNRLGQHQLVVGPRLLYLYFSVVQFLTRYVASSYQYIQVDKHDGSTIIQKGPCSEWFCPVLHRSVKVCDAIELVSENDLCVVKSVNQSALRIEKGPQLFFPSPGERLVEFEWQVGPQTRILRRFQKFTVQLTHDQADMTLEVTAFLKSIDTLLSHSSFNVLSDVRAALGQDQHKGKSIETMTTTHSALEAALKTRGFELMAVAVAGSTKHQRMQELELRERQASMDQRLADLALEGEEERAQRRALLKKRQEDDLVVFLGKLSQAGVDVARLLPVALSVQHQGGITDLSEQMRKALQGD